MLAEMGIFRIRIDLPFLLSLTFRFSKHSTFRSALMATDRVRIRRFRILAFQKAAAWKYEQVNVA